MLGINSENIDDCLRTAKNIKNHLAVNTSMVVGGQGVIQSKNRELYKVFDQITTNPSEALKLIVEHSYN